MRFKVIELKNGKTGICDNETGHIMVSIEGKGDFEKGVKALNHLCNKFDENDKRYNGENILAYLRKDI